MKATELRECIGCLRRRAAELQRHVAELRQHAAAAEQERRALIQEALSLEKELFEIEGRVQVCSSTNAPRRRSAAPRRKADKQAVRLVEQMDIPEDVKRRLLEALEKVN